MVNSSNFYGVRSLRPASAFTSFNSHTSPSFAMVSFPPKFPQGHNTPNFQGISSRILSRLVQPGPSCKNNFVDRFEGLVKNPLITFQAKYMVYIFLVNTIIGRCQASCGLIEIELIDKTLLFRRRRIDKLTLCVKEKRVTICWGFELFHVRNVVLDTGSRETYFFRNRNFGIFHLFWPKLDRRSPLNLMAIFLKRLNLVLNRSLNGIIRIAVEIILTGRDLRIPGPDRSPALYT